MKTHIFIFKSKVNGMSDLLGYGSFVCIGSKFRAPKLYFTYCCRRNCHQGGVLEQIQKNPDNPTTREYILEQIWSKNWCLGTFETLNCRILRIFNVSFSVNSNHNNILGHLKIHRSLEFIEFSE